jgi:hypothetical protein
MLKKGSRRRKRPPKANDFWAETRSLLKTGGVTPFISNCVCYDIFRGGKHAVAKSWAKDEEIQSPLSEQDNRELARVAQYFSVQKSNLKAKEHYLNSLKSYLLGLAEDDLDFDQDLLDEVYDNVEEKTLSKVAAELGYPKFASAQENPLRLLAELPLKVYVTTSYHNFLEVALSNVPKKPVTEIFYWDDSLHWIPSIFDQEPNFEPTVEQPLVYHLYGLDDYPASLVLTEDDYLDYLIKVSQESFQIYQKEQRRGIPTSIRRALSGSSLLLLGYDVYDWEFRVLFRGLIQAMNDLRKTPNSPEGILMQIKPGVGVSNPDRVKAYLEEYFKQSKFKVFWGDIHNCVQELWNLQETKGNCNGQSD